jgi:hypothetical protein
MVKVEVAKELKYKDTYITITILGDSQSRKIASKVA